LAEEKAMTAGRIAKTDARASAAARGYGHRWRRLRRIVLAQEPLCRMCTAVGRTTAAVVVDHIKAKRDGGTDARENLQPLCSTCHDAIKQAEEKGGGVRGCGLDGVPLDPAHHWR
jgi:5-methylcytosine-specific restriction endonuclease McrA